LLAGLSDEDAAVQIMRALGFQKYAVLGWSLGGHIGLEMMKSSRDVIGLMISGTPPMGRGDAGMQEAFVPSRHMTLAGQRYFSDEEIDAYSRATCGVNAPFESFLRDAVARTDGRAREISSSHFRKQVGYNQREAAENSEVPLAIVNGADDEFINHDYIASLNYRNLWEGEVYSLPGIGHAPFWEVPEQFDPHLIRFVESVHA
jgi:pimeloyl-ACP methyl ester carboxylesterase